MVLMMTERILVTGGTGFLGQHLVRTLRQQNLAVRVLVRPKSNCQPLAASGAEFVVGDVLDPTSLSAALKDVTAVFHLAGQLHMPGITNQAYNQLHIDGTHNLLQACLDVPSLRVIIHGSTTGVLGPTGSILATENAFSTQGPSNAYEQSKARGEQLALDFAKEHNLPLIAVRPSLVYGPGDLHLLGWFRAIKRGYYRVVGSGDNLLHPIYIDDLIKGLLCCLQSNPGKERIYNLVGPQPVSIKELAAAIAHAMGHTLPRWHLPLLLARAAATLFENLPGLPPTSLPLTHSRIDFMIESRAYCGQRACTELGFIPNIDLETGLEQTVAWYHREGLL
jgi:dihydroflavonol-4-reductase